MSFNFNTTDNELDGLTQRPDPDMLRVVPSDVANNGADDGRVNPVQRQLQQRPEQPEIDRFIINRVRDSNMPANGGQKKKRTSKHSKKYKNKYRQRRTRRVMKKRK